MARPHIALVSREVWPFMPGGGIGRGVRDTALALAPECDVTVVTSRRYEDRFAAVAAEPGAWVAEPGIAFAWADEPEEDPAPFWSPAHAWSAACREALAAVAAERPIDLVEFGDYGGAAAVTLQARRSGDPVLGDVPVVVRLHTTWEMARALDAQPVDDLAGRVLAALERTSLAMADVLIAPGPTTAAAYREAYGEDALAPLVFAPPAFALPEASETEPPSGDALRLLFVGRLQHLKGADALVEAVRARPGAELALTLVGGDTPTGPGGGSMRAHIDELRGGDPRITLLDAVEPEQLPGLFAEHHLVVLPSLFEAFGYVAREANAANRPVLVAPVGGLRDAVEAGLCGRLLAAASPAALVDALADPSGLRDEIDALVREHAPRRAVEEAARVAASDLVAAYLELARGVTGTPGGPPSAHAQVTVVITATHNDHDVVGTLLALRRLGAPDLRVIVATDDPATVPAATLDELTALHHVDPGPEALVRARRAALTDARDDTPVLLLRAGERPGAGFLDRAARVLAADARAAYVTAFTRGRLTGRAPLGNRVGTVIGIGEASATIALFRAGVLGAEAIPDAPAGEEDLELFGALAARGAVGVVAPDPLVDRSFPRRRAELIPRTAAPELRVGAGDWAGAQP